MAEQLAARGIEVSGGPSVARRLNPGDDSAAQQAVDANVTPVSADILATAQERIVARLRRRGLSEAEVLRAALDEELDAHQANEILEQLRSWGYVDDRSLAEQLLAKAQTRKGQGREAARRSLAERLIRSDIIDDVLAEIDDADELERALELAQRRVARLHGLERDAAQRRLSGFLARRGYSGAIVRQAVDQALAGSTASPVRFTST